MKNKISIFILVSCLVLNFSYAQTITPAAPSLNSNGIATAVNAGTNASYGSDRAARCSSRRFDNCIKAAAGFAQVITSLMQMMGTMGSRDMLSPGTNWELPGFENEIGPIHPEDRDYFDPILNAVESGNLVDYQNARDQILAEMQPDLDKLRDMGITIDPTTGAVTTPPGSPSLSDIGGADPGGRFDDYNSKTIAALGGSGTGSGSGGSSGSGVGSANDGRSLASANGSGVDSFLKKLDKGELEGDKLNGMSKNTKEGDAIGVAMGNLFKMVHVKYKALNTKQEFK